MKEGLIKDTYELILKEIQTIITLSYLVAVGIGMLFNYQKYSEFQINIFDYGDVFDFLIAPFSDFYIFLFTTGSILLVYFIILMDSFWKRKWPKIYSIANFRWDNKRWFTAYRTTIFIVSFIFYLYLAADYYGKYKKTKIINQNEISLRLADNEIKTGKLIGKTKDIVFLMDGENIYALPITSLVKEIKIK